MSSFQILRDSNYLNKVGPLAIQGSTCDAFVIALHGRKQFVKKLKPEFAIDPIYVSLFAKEYNVGKTLSHPNLVRYNNIETTKEGVLMFLDYISGETLADKLSSNPGFFLNEANLRRFTVQLLSCLSYLHSMQIVHLDIKPENLMLTQVDNSLKVLDLGFCYTDIYSPLVGKTDQFAAPEQLADTTSGLCAKTDLYAVGKILEYIEARTGHSLPRKYEALKELCLERNPEDRPASASACIAMLGDGRRWRWLAFSLFMLLVVLFSVLNPSARKVVLYSLENIHIGRCDIQDRAGISYRIVSERERTCEVIGYSKVLDIDGDNIMINHEVSHFGRTYKVIGIADDAFRNDSISLSVYIPNGIEYLGARAVHNCCNLTTITIPPSVERIGEDCFGYDSLLHTAVLPDGLDEIADNLFVSCKSLESINIPESVTRIGKDSFVGCSGLSSISIPPHVSEIARGAFFNCSGLRTIVIPESVRFIGDYAFYGCSSLTDVFMLSEKPMPIASVFPHRVVVHVPEGSAADYKSTPGWDKLRIVE